jgi:chemotaxis protein methyltransferase CheR
VNSDGPAPGIRDDRAYQKLKEHLIGATGLAYYTGRDDTLAPIVEHRLAALNLSECGPYLDLLRGETGEKELHAIAARLTIGETYFFRNLEHFNALRTLILPEILGRKAAERRLYIWSAGCANGAEPYSISIVLRREFARETAGWDVRILGTDINDVQLEQAREGRFQEWAFRSRQPLLEETCFQKDGACRIIAPAYRAGVSFEYHNLIEGRLPPPGFGTYGCDLIFCRNVLIYFGPESVSRVVHRFHECLAPHGWLVVGPAETDIGAFDALFTANCKGSVLYQKRVSADRVESPQTSMVSPAGSGSVRMESARPASESSPEGNGAGPALAQICLLADRGEWEKSLQYCAQAVLEDGLNPLVYFYHAMVMDHLGEIQEARKSLRKAIYLDRAFVLGHYHLALSLQKENDREQAARHFRTALDLLSGMSGGQTFAAGDGITAQALRELVKFHLEALTK